MYFKFVTITSCKCHVHGLEIKTLFYYRLSDKFYFHCEGSILMSATPEEDLYPVYLLPQ